MRPLAPLAISLLLLLTRCGSGGAAGGAANTPPVVVGEGVPDAVGPLFGGPIVVDLRAAFDDAEDPGALTLAMVALTGASIATAVVEGDAGRLVWTPLAPGLAEVVVRATDPDGRSVDDVATLTVTATVVTIDLDATADATLYPDAISANGAGDHVFVGTVAGSAPLPRRGVLRFDVGSLPSEAVVLEVMLLLEITRAPFIGPAASFAVHRLTRAFDEGTTDAEANEGTGAPAAAGDATWTHARWPSDAWTTPGGDFDPVPSGVDDPLVAEPSVALVGDGLASDVRRWRAGEPAHGWIVLGNESLTRTVRRFGSRTHPEPDRRPRLRVRLAVP